MSKKSTKPALETLHGALHEESTDDEVRARLQRLTYGYAFPQGHVGELGELRTAIRKGEKLLPGRDRAQALQLVHDAIEHSHALAAQQQSITPILRPLYRIHRALSKH